MFTCREDLAWAAGLYDGEGSTGAFKNLGPKSKMTYPRASVYQNDSEVLLKFKSITGLGTIYPVKASKTKKAAFLWVVQGFEKTQALMGLLWPWLGSLKKAQFRNAMLSYKETHQ